MLYPLVNTLFNDNENNKTTCDENFLENNLIALLIGVSTGIILTLVSIKILQYLIKPKRQNYRRLVPDLASPLSPLSPPQSPPGEKLTMTVTKPSSPLAL